MNDPIEWELLDRYLAGEASAEESARVERWIASSPERAAMLRVLGPGRPRAAERTDQAWASLAERIAGAGELAPRTAHPARHGRRYWLRAASVAAMLAVGGGIWHLAGREREEPMVAVATAPGAMRSLTLEDGTRVTLGADSRLERPRRSRRDGREVVLRGEAFFEVVHDAARPFTVRSGGAVTRVLGTRFGVRAYPGEPVRVVVESGKVRLRPARAESDTGVVLVRSQMGIAAPGERVSRREGIDPARYTAWLRGGLELDRVPLAEAARELERRYGITVRVPDPALARRRVTLSIDRPSLEPVLNTLSVSHGTRWTRVADTVFILSIPPP